MKGVVDPSPQVWAELDVARRRFQPLLDDLDRQLSAASSRSERKHIRHRKRDINRQYEEARRHATWPLRSPIAWWLGGK